MKLSELNIIDFPKNGNAVTFRTDQSADIVVTFISDKTARLYNDWSFWLGSFNIILGNAQELYIGC